MNIAKTFGWERAYFTDLLATKLNALWLSCFAPVTLSVCMIVRDEEPVLERCLKAAVQFADQLVVVDTGSKDRTMEIAKKYTTEVYTYQWKDDFADARNFSYSKAACDYIMWLDADDDIEPEDIRRIIALKNNMPPSIDVVTMFYTGDEDIRYANNVLRDRLVRRSLGLKWLYPIHEAIKFTKGLRFLHCPDIAIYHRKKVVNEPRRNLRIFEEKMAEGFQLDSFNRFYLCRELFLHKRYAEAVDVFAQVQKDGDKADIESSLLYYAESMVQLKRYHELFEALCAYIERCGENAMALCYLGDLCRRFGENNRAIEFYEKALRTQRPYLSFLADFPAYREFLPLLGIAKACLKLEDLPKASHMLKIAEKLSPNDNELKILKLALEWKEQKNLVNKGDL